MPVQRIEAEPAITRASLVEDADLVVASVSSQKIADCVPRSTLKSPAIGRSAEALQLHPKTIGGNVPELKEIAGVGVVAAESAPGGSVEIFSRNRKPDS